MVGSRRKIPTPANAPQVEIFRLDDWVWVFVDGKLITENHSVDEDAVIERLVGTDRYEHTNVADQVGYKTEMEFYEEFGYQRRGGEPTPAEMWAWIRAKREEQELG